MRFIKEKKDFTKIAVVLALGLLLIFIGNKGEKTAMAEDDVESRIAAACSGVEGVGECEVYVYSTYENSRDTGEVQSVIVICEGADSVDVRYRLTQMLSSFFGIGANRIKIEKKSS